MPEGELISVTINDGIKKFSELNRHDNSNDDKSKYKKVCVGDIAYNSMRMWQGASGFSPYEGIVSPAYTILSPIRDIVDSKCISYLFKRQDILYIFQKNSQGITSDNWNLKYPALSNIEIKVSSSIIEQKKIGELFTNIDNLITLHQRKSNHIFYSWEQRKFDTLAKVDRGLTYSPNNLANNGIRVLRSSNINDDQFKLYDEDVFVTPNSINIEYANNNDILITSANGSSRLVGKHTIIKGISSGSTVHGGFMLLARPYINSHFLNASMSSSWYKKFIDLYVAGGNGAIGNLSKTDLDNQIVNIPNESEINKIGDLFKNIDNLITLHQRNYFLK